MTGLPDPARLTGHTEPSRRELAHSAHEARYRGGATHAAQSNGSLTAPPVR